MEWKQKARRVEEFIKQQKAEKAARLAKQKAEKEEAKRRAKELYPKVRGLSSRIERVCKEFARSIRGRVATGSPYWGESGPPCVFQIRGARYITIAIDKTLPNISITTYFYTDEFFAQCPPYDVRDSSPEPYSMFYRKLDYQLDTGKHLWEVHYNIAWEQFTEDELATVLEILCKEMQSEKVSTHPR